MATKKNKLKIVNSRIDKPDVDLINDYIKRFDDRFGLAEKAVNTVFKATRDNEPAEVLARVVILNQLYSAGLNDNVSEKHNSRININVYDMTELLYKYADRIKACKKQKDVFYLIRIISAECYRNKYNNAYSFLSKYFSWRFKDLNIPIIDRYVKGMIYYLGKIYYSMDINQGKLKDYDYFCELYEDIYQYIIKENHIEYSYKKLDKYLWEYGKEFSKEYVDISI